MAYIYSRLSADMKYKIEGYNDDGSDRFVFVAGKADIPNKHMLTVRGVSTQVDDALVKLLEKNPVFQLHVENGVIHVDKHKVDAEKVASDMAADDSRPLSEEELEALDGKAPRKSTGTRKKA